MSALTPVTTVPIYKNEVEVGQIPLYDLYIPDFDTGNYFTVYFTNSLSFPSYSSNGTGTYRIGNIAFKISSWGFGRYEHFIGTYDGSYHFPESGGVSSSSTLDSFILVRGAEDKIILCYRQYDSYYYPSGTYYLSLYLNFTSELSLPAYNPSYQRYYNVEYYVSSYEEDNYSAVRTVKVGSSTKFYEKYPGTTSPAGGDYYPKIGLVDFDGSTYTTKLYGGLKVAEEIQGNVGVDYSITKFGITVLDTCTVKEIILRLSPYDYLFDDSSGPSPHNSYFTFTIKVIGNETYLNFRAIGNTTNPDVPVADMGSIPSNLLWVTPFSIGTKIYFRYDVILPENVTDDVGSWTKYDGAVAITPVEQPYTAVEGEDYSLSEDGRILTILGNGKAQSIVLKVNPTDIKFDSEGYDGLPQAIINIKIGGRGGGLGPYEPGGTTGTTGGGGTFGKDEISDDVSVDLPDGSTDASDSATGMYTRYLMNSSYLDLLGEWVWDPNLGLSLIQTAIKPFFNDPEQALISLISFPFQLAAPLVGISTRQQPCYFGHQPTGATFVALTTQSAQINWGTIDLQEYWGNFLDYAPHTKIELYLPWGTGFVNLDPGQCLPGTLTVITNIELQRGSCVHNVVNSAGCVIGSYAGQCGKQIPLIASDIAAKRAGLVTAAAGALVAGAAIAATPAAMASGYSAGIANSGIVSASRVPAISTPSAAQYRADVASSFGMKGAETALNTVEKGVKVGANIASKSSIASLKTPVSVQRNGGFTDGSAGMGIQYPYIILSRPEQNVPENYGHHFGYPSNVYVNLGSLRGYTEIGSIHLDSIPATNAELEELDGILKGGVIF